MTQEHVELWGGEWSPALDGGRVTLPVVAGIRRGHLTGRVSAREKPEGTELILEVEETHYRVHRPALVVLLFGLAGALATIVLPLFPRYMPLFPVASLLTLVAWFLVVTRIRSGGAEPFLDNVEALLTPEHGVAEDDP